MVEGMDRVRMSVVFHGRVQGVGFRHTVLELAPSFRVSGTVENRPDGTVAMEAEGAKDACEAFLEAVRLRLGRFIGGLDVAWREPEGKESGFRILH